MLCAILQKKIRWKQLLINAMGVDHTYNPATYHTSLIDNSCDDEREPLRHCVMKELPERSTWLQKLLYGCICNHGSLLLLNVKRILIQWKKWSMFFLSGKDILHISGKYNKKVTGSTTKILSLISFMYLGNYMIYDIKIIAAVGYQLIYMCMIHKSLFKNAFMVRSKIL